MNEPGFTFILEFPMVLAPSIVVPILILLNALLAWKSSRSSSQDTPAGLPESALVSTQQTRRLNTLQFGTVFRHVLRKKLSSQISA